MSTEQQPVTIVRRGAGGRFLPGTAGGPGRLPERAVRLKDALLAAIEPEEIAAVGRKLLEMSLAGDPKAMEILLRTLIPKGAGAGGAQVLIQNNINNSRRCLEIAERIRSQRMAEQQVDE